MKENLYAYPITISKDEDDFIVYIPDFEINTSGKSLAEAIFMARDAIGLMGLTLEDEGKEIPKADINLKQELEDGKILTFVDVNFDEYRKKHDSRLIKKNCTLPYNLCLEAEKRGINFSAVLREALQEKLEIKER